MKKILMFVFTFLVLFGFVSNVDAVVPNNNENGFEINSKYNFTIDEDFDYSKISFSSNVSGVSIPGSSALHKIFSTYEKEGSTKYFTAYCFDGNRAYPNFQSRYNQYIGDDFDISSTDDVARAKQYIRYLTFHKVMIECEKVSTCTLFDNKDILDAYSLSNDDFIYLVTTSGSDAVFTKIGDVSNDVIASFVNGDPITVAFSKMYYSTKDSNTNIVTITADNFAGTNGISNNSNIVLNSGTNVNKFAIDIDDYKINNYTAKDISEKEEYKKALWIIEHSYPNLTLETSLSTAGVNLDILRSDVAGYLGLEDNTTNSAKISEEVQNYVYSTVQYAIWKVIGDFYEIVSDGSSGKVTAKLGDSLTGNEQLNTLYQYLIRDRGSEYTDYEDKVFGKSLTLTFPESGKELKSTTSDAYIYGPYVIGTDMITVGPINVSATPANGVSVTDASGNPIASANLGDSIYLKVLKSAKVSNIKVLLSTSSGVVFANDSRGVLLTSDSSVFQTIGSGAVTTTINVESEIEIIVNPKTGVEDIGKILLVMLIAFTLGYVALRFKQQPLDELN